MHQSLISVCNQVQLLSGRSRAGARVSMASLLLRSAPELPQKMSTVRDSFHFKCSCGVSNTGCAAGVVRPSSGNASRHSTDAVPPT